MASDEEIIVGLRETPEAFAILYRRHVGALLGYFLRRTHDPELAADLCAETFAAALDGAHRFDPERGPVVARLYGIARRLLARAQRRGAVEDRARRRLGMAPLELTDAALDRIEGARRLGGGARGRAGGAAGGSAGGGAGACRRRARLRRDRACRAHVRIGDPQARLARACRDDFVRDLEVELVAAARFPATHGRRRPRATGTVPVGLRRALLGTVALALLVAIVVLAAALAGGGDDRAADERPAPRRRPRR